MSQTIPTPSSQHATVDCRPFWNFGTVTALAPMLGQYTCMGINNNINNGIRERTHEYQKCNSSRILIFGGYIYLGERIFVYSSYYLGYSYSNHIQIRMIYLCMKVLVWYIDSNGVNNKNTTKDPYPTGIIMVSTEDSTSPTLVLSHCTHAYAGHHRTVHSTCRRWWLAIWNFGVATMSTPMCPCCSKVPVCVVDNMVAI